MISRTQQTNKIGHQIMYAIDQPWGVTISDVTVRAAGVLYII